MPDSRELSGLFPIGGYCLVLENVLKTRPRVPPVGIPYRTRSPGNSQVPQQDLMLCYRLQNHCKYMMRSAVPGRASSPAGLQG